MSTILTLCSRCNAEMPLRDDGQRLCKKCFTAPEETKGEQKDEWAQAVARRAEQRLLSDIVAFFDVELHSDQLEQLSHIVRLAIRDERTRCLALAKLGMCSPGGLARSIFGGIHPEEYDGEVYT